MLIGFFRQDRPTAFFPLPLLILLLWPGAGTGGGGPLTAGAEVTGQTVQGMPLYAPFRWLMDLSPWVAMAMGIMLVLGLAHGLNRMANDAELYDRRNHLPVLLLPLLLALMPFGFVPGPAFLGVWAVIWALARSWTAMARTQILSPLFDAGLLMGIAALFYLPFAFLTVVIWATLAVTRPIKWREYIMPVLGMVLMLFIGWGVTRFIAPSTWDPIASLHFPTDQPALPAAHWMYGVILSAVLLVLAISVVISFAAVYSGSVMREKNIRAAFLAFTFAMGLLALFAWWLDRRIPPVLLAVPATLLLSYPMLQTRRTAWAEAGVWCLLLLGCWARWTA